jgi:hypothetical protein
MWVSKAGEKLQRDLMIATTSLFVWRKILNSLF